MNTLKLQPKPKQRILIMSDIHGNLPLFNSTLEALSFSTDDILIVNGDISEKGNDSIGLFRRLINLKKTHTVYNTLGNCDELLLFLNNDAKNEGMEHYMMHRNNTILSEFLKAYGPYTSFQDLKHFAKNNYADIFDFVAATPLKIETPHFDVIHAGINPNDPEDTSYCLRTYGFLRNEFFFDKPLIVGHFPTCLYHKGVISHNVIFDFEHNIIAIDGGNSIKPEGQINVVIAVDDHFEALHFDCLDYIPSPFTQSQKVGVNITWEDSEIEIIKKKKEVSLCKHVSTTTLLEIPNAFLNFDSNTLLCDYTNALIEVNKNDAIHIILETSFGLYIKCRGSIGWIIK